jgi:hypothetical protein
VYGVALADDLCEDDDEETGVAFMLPRMLEEEALTDTVLDAEAVVDPPVLYVCMHACVDMCV